MQKNEKQDIGNETLEERVYALERHTARTSLTFWFIILILNGLAAVMNVIRNTTHSEFTTGDGVMLFLNSACVCIAAYYIKRGIGVLTQIHARYYAKKAAEDNLPC